MKKTYKKWIIAGLLFLLLAGIIPPPLSIKSSKDFTVTCNIEKVYACTRAKQIAVSGGHLFLLNGSTDIILFENERNVSIYRHSETIYDFSAIQRTLILPDALHSSSNYSLLAIGFDNYSSPNILSNITSPTTGGIEISVYNDHIYTANQEMGFLIYDFSNVSNPQPVGKIPLNTWHAQQVFVTSDFAFLSGDFRTGIYDLSHDPVNATLIAEIEDESNEWFWIAGRPGASSEYFVINHFESIEKISVIHIIPRLNVTPLTTVYSTTCPAENKYKHCGLVHTNFLVVSGANNEILLFEITKNGILSLISEINLGINGTINDMYQIGNTNEFYVADGANGLLKLSITDIQVNNTENSIPAFAFEILLYTLLCLFIFKERKLSLRKLSDCK